MPPPRPTWGHQPGFVPYPMMPPRRKSSSGPVLALVLGGVVILGLGAVGVFAASFNHKVKDTGYSNYTTYSPTYTYSTTTDATTTTTASTRTSSTRSTSTSSTPTTPAGPKAIYKLADHPIFSTGVGANDFAACALPPMRYDPAGEEAFLSAALPCIEKAWQPAMKAANLPYQPAELQVFSGSTQSPCGSRRADSTAMYCQGIIYWPAGFYANEKGGTRHPGVYLGQLSHEYGHHIQWLAGFLKAANQAQYDVGGFDTAKGLELNRRKELQATCFGGMTLAPFSHKNVIPMDVVNTGLTDASQRGDYDRTPADHGSAPNNDRWVMHGHKQNDIKACNTWAASSADVS